MSLFHLRSSGIRKRTAFLLILSLVIVVYQVVNLQHKLSASKLQGKNIVLSALAKLKFFEKDVSKRSLKNQSFSEPVNSLDLELEEIEVIQSEEYTDLLKNEKSKNKLSDVKYVDEKDSSRQFNSGVKVPGNRFVDEDEAQQDSEEEQQVVSFASWKRQKFGDSADNRNDIESNLPQIGDDELQADNKRDGTFQLKDMETQKANTVSSLTSDEGNILSGKIGFLNLHIWNNLCQFSVNSLKEFILFPKSPNFRNCVNKTEVHGIGKNIGIRMFGILLPDVTGSYKFGISSLGNSELCLSNDTNPKNLRRIAFVGHEKERAMSKPGRFEDFPSQTSESIHLVKESKYFFEVLHKHTAGRYGVELAWMKPTTSSFQIISGNSTSTMLNDCEIEDDKVIVEDYEETLTATSLQGINYMFFMDFFDFEEAFRECDYEPSYYVKKKLVRYQGARNKSNTHFAEIYPPDSTNKSLPLVKAHDIWWIENNYGNDVIDSFTAEHVGKMFTQSMEKLYNGTFKIHKMMSLERVADKVKGDRYHIQMEIEDQYSGRHFEFSEFLYHPRGAGSLCWPRGFRWSKYGWVNIIVPLKNNGRWALYFIKNIAEIIGLTREPHLHVIFVDYESTDIDIKAVLKRSSLRSYTVVTLPGNKTFNRAEALQKGADTVHDPHSILFMCDLHLKIPAMLIGAIRKHCVEGKMAFAPVVKRLRCGSYPTSPFGYWETLGFGLFALYKSDFDRVGAMNVKEFQKWGGEDWELLDRVLESQIEVERLKIPSFYHFFHPAVGDNSRNNAR